MEEDATVAERDTNMQYVS